MYMVVLAEESSLVSTVGQCLAYRRISLKHNQVFSFITIHFNWVKRSVSRCNLLSLHQKVMHLEYLYLFICSFTLKWISCFYPRCWDTVVYLTVINEENETSYVIFIKHLLSVQINVSRDQSGGSEPELDLSHTGGNRLVIFFYFLTNIAI